MVAFLRTMVFVTELSMMAWSLATDAVGDHISLLQVDVKVADKPTKYLNFTKMRDASQECCAPDAGDDYPIGFCCDIMDQHSCCPGLTCMQWNVADMFLLTGCAAPNAVPGGEPIR